jgi:hypothetical protein
VQQNHLRQRPVSGAHHMLIVRVSERPSNHDVADLARSALPRRDGTMP